MFIMTFMTYYERDSKTLKNGLTYCTGTIDIYLKLPRRIIAEYRYTHTHTHMHILIHIHILAHIRIKLY